jgi:acyl carrier protein
MCSNPIARGAQRYGSVGVPTGTEVAIIDVHGAVVPSGAVGEIVIRGEGVTAGYIADASVNAAAFARGWFRTGDLGRFDADGYLYLEGRIKELINRGGEKISPREIDDVLMSHPGVAQAVAFPIPDARLGEEVGAAVVLTSGALIDERTLIEFAAERLAEWKIPRRVAIVAELPTGPTGKLMRTGLAERLDLHASVVPLGSHLSTPQATLFMDLLAAIWCDVLKVPSVDVVADADFLALGGDSLMAAQVIARVRNECGRELSILAFFDHPTLSSMAAAIAESPPVAASVLNARYMASID